MPFPVSDLLRQIGRSYYALEPGARRIVNTGIGGAVGAGAGAILGDDEEGSLVAPAIVGGLMGAFATPHSRIPRELGDLWSRQQDELIARGAAPQIDRKTRFQSTLYDRLAPWLNKLGYDEKQQAIVSNAFGGGASDAELALHPLRDPIRNLAERGLIDHLDTYFRYGVADRAYQTLAQRKTDLEQEIARARGAGDRFAEQNALAEFHATKQKLDEHAVTFGGLTPDQIAEGRQRLLTELGPEDSAHVEDVANQVYNTVWDTTARRRAGGLLTEDYYNQQLERMKNGIRYVPGWRDLLAENTEGMGLAAQSLQEFGRRKGLSVKGDPLIQKLVGGTRDPIHSPLENALWNIQEGNKEVARNDAARTLIEGAVELQNQRGVQGMLDQTGGFAIRPLTEMDPLRPGEGIVAYMKDGIAQRFAVPVEWADAMNFTASDDVLKGLKTLNRFMRFNSRLITSSNLAFAFRNIPRDVVDALMLSGVGKTPGQFFQNWGRAVLDTLTDNLSEARRDFMAHRGGHATLMKGMAENPLYAEIGQRGQTPVQALMGRVQGVLNAFEEGTKVATFQTLKNQGLDPDIAAFRSRRYGGSPDFARKGTMAAGAQSLIQFWNPQVQGIVRNVEAFAANPARLASYLGAFTAAYSALDTYNRSFTDEDTGRPAIESIPPNERLNNIIIMLPGAQQTASGQSRNNYVKIPLGHAARMVLNPIQDAFRMAYGEAGAPTAGQAVADTAQSFLPLSNSIDAKDPITSTVVGLAGSTNPLIKAPLEQAANFQFYNQVPIVGTRVAGSEPIEQFTENTSSTAKKIAGMMNAIGAPSWLQSPDRVEHMIRTFLPGAGEFPLGALDWKYDPTQSASEAITELPVLGPMARSIMPNRQDMAYKNLADPFYQALGKAQQVQQTYSNMVRSGREQDAEQYALGHEEQMGLNRPMQRLARQLGAISRYKDAVKNDPTMTPEQKREELRSLYLQQLELLRDANSDLILPLL